MDISLNICTIWPSVILKLWVANYDLVISVVTNSMSTDHAGIDTVHLVKAVDEKSGYSNNKSIYWMSHTFT